MEAVAPKIIKRSIFARIAISTDSRYDHRIVFNDRPCMRSVSIPEYFNTS